MQLLRKLRAAIGQRAGREPAPYRSAAPACILSFLLHLTALVVLAWVTMLLPTQRTVVLSARPFDPDPEPVVEEYRFAQMPQLEVGALSFGGVEGGRPAALVASEESQVEYDLLPTTPVADLRVLEFDQNVMTGRNVTENMLVRGVGSVGSLGAEGAIDRITHEILLSLEQRPTLVIWLFDQSGSLKSQREAIAGRFDRVYDELGAIEAAGNPAFRRHNDKPLLSAVASFGQSVALLTPRPTDDVTDLKASVRAVADDASGRENVFQAVQFLVNKLRHYRLRSPQRNVMLVVFTDEAGDDLDHLDAAIETCRKLAVPVYVVGVPAPFGREDAFVKYVDPDPKFDQSVQWLPVHQGPESLLPERVRLAFAGGSRYEEERIDSGFGPFGLCRLATETGGLYFTVHPNRKVGEPVPSWVTAAYSSHLGAFFDERVMRNYRPDYVSAQQYREILAENRACRALVEAAQLSWTAPMDNVRLDFPRIDDGQLNRDLTVAQRTAARIEPKISALLATLRQGEPDRPKIARARWQAGYDLAMGRTLAVAVRTFGYNAVLAEAKRGMTFKNPANDTWVLRPAHTISSGHALAKQAADAKAYLQRVVDEHPGTPWAFVAQRELQEPMGWQWRERFTGVAARVAQQAANNRPQPQLVPVDPQPPKKPRRDPPAL